MRKRRTHQVGVLTNHIIRKDEKNPKASSVFGKVPAIRHDRTETVQILTPMNMFIVLRG